MIPLTPDPRADVTVNGTNIRDGVLLKLYVTVRDTNYHCVYALEPGSFDVLSSGAGVAQGVSDLVRGRSTVPWNHVLLLLDTWREQERVVKALHAANQRLENGKVLG